MIEGMSKGVNSEPEKPKAPIRGKARPSKGIPHIEALRVILSAEAPENHNEVVLAEMPAIVSHWLQTPAEEPLVLPLGTGDKWRRILSELARQRSAIQRTKSRASSIAQFKIDYSGIPFPVPDNPKFTFIDLFAGIGGFRIALQQLGGKCVFSSEWEPRAKEAYDANHGEIPFGDIKNFTAGASAPAVFHNSIPKHDIIAGGFPCQAFSQAGKQLGFNEARGTLFFEILKIAKAQRPKALILENVKRLRTHDKGRTFAVIANSLREIGYKVYAKVLRAYDFGLPQNRERIFIVAFDEAIHFEFPKPASFRSIHCVGDILEKNVDKWYTISDRMYDGHKRRLSEHRARGNGFGFSVFPPSAPYTNTISARYWKDGSEILIDQSPANPRMLTPRECARLQGFPDEFRPHHSRRHAYQQFGNSVPVPVVKRVAEEVLNALSKKLPPSALLDPMEPVIL